MNELVDYVRKELKNGQTEEQVRESLVAAGRPAEEVEDAFFRLEELEAEGHYSRIVHKRVAYIVITVVAVLVVSAVAFYGTTRANAPPRTEPVVEDHEADQRVLREALIERNETRCEDLVSDTARESCSKAFKKGEDGECDTVCEDNRLMNNALTKDNRTACLEIRNNYTREHCTDILDTRDSG